VSKFSIAADVVISSSIEIEGELSEAEGYLRAMDIEFRSLASADKRSAQQKVNDYREEIKRLHQQHQSSKFNAESIALKAGPSARGKLLTSNQKLDQSTAALEQSRMLIAQAENTGNVILTDMESQKELLTDAHGKVKETRDFTVEARRVLRSMGNRAIMHKLCVMLTIVGLAAAIGAVAYYGVAKK
jgi:hypothetical protein